MHGQNVNFVRGLVDKSLGVQINAIRIKFVEYKHRYRNQHAVLHKLYTWSLDETWSKVWGDEVVPSKMLNFGGRRGLTVLVNFNI